MLLVSNKSSNGFLEFLNENNFDYILTKNNPNLDSRIADHPDLSLSIIDDNTIVIDESLKEYYIEKITNRNIIWGESARNPYPYDAIYNIYKGSNFYIHNSYTETNIEKFMMDHDIRHYSTKQGYTRCSIIPMGDKILTSDLGIYKSLRNKIEVILLKEDYIPLDGFDYGFIGGTCGLVHDTLIFNGNIRTLDSYEIIKDEASRSGIKLLYPDDLPLRDLGSIFHL